MPTNPYKQMMFTRNLYRFETEYFLQDGKAWTHIVKQRSLRSLRQTLIRVWGDLRPCTPMPILCFGKGVGGLSWFQEGRIVLAPGQRDLLTLLHEIVHALGYGHHNVPFVKAYFKLLSKYGKVPLRVLRRGAADYNVALK